MIVVGVDGSRVARAAVLWAADDAVRMREPLRIVHAIDRLPYEIAAVPASDWADALVHGGQRIVAQAETLALERQPSVSVSTELRDGSPSTVLREVARQAVELVVGSRGLGGFVGVLLGSVSTYLAAHGHGTVVVVREASRAPHRQIVVGLDDTTGSELALKYAFEQASLRGATLRVVHAWTAPSRVYAPAVVHTPEETLAARRQLVVDRIAPLTRCYTQVAVIEDVQCLHPVDALTRASAEADLLVVGSEGRHAVGPAPLGSVGRAVVHHARCTVAIVRMPA
ncbi:universal stress protein [Nonomuraea dietziae]|uniref:universal stress protein n=1 Tax=Nonomuraea dietziae TaxID=65515 RepID=UPI0034170968